MAEVSPYVRLLKVTDQEYQLEVMLPIDEDPERITIEENREATQKERELVGSEISYFVQLQYSSSYSSSNYTLKTVTINLANPNTGNLGAIGVVASKSESLDSHGPKADGKAVIQFEYALEAFG